MLGEPGARGAGTTCRPRAVAVPGERTPSQVRVWPWWGRSQEPPDSLSPAGQTVALGVRGGRQAVGTGHRRQEHLEKTGLPPRGHLRLPEGLGGLLPGGPPQAPLSGCCSRRPPGIFPERSSDSGQRGFTRGSLRSALEVTGPKAREGAAAPLVLPTDLRGRRTPGAAAQPRGSEGRGEAGSGRGGVSLSIIPLVPFPAPPPGSAPGPLSSLVRTVLTPGVPSSSSICISRFPGANQRPSFLSLFLHVEAFADVPVILPGAARIFSVSFS